MRAAQRSYGEDAAAVATLGKALPTDDQTASLLYQLDAAAGRSHVVLKSIAPSGATTAATATLPVGVTEVSLALTFAGRFADLQRFLARVRDATSVHGDAVRVRGRLLAVKTLQMTTDTAHPGRVEANLEAAAYLATAAPPAAPAASGAPPVSSTASAAPPTQAAMIGAGG